MHLDNLNVACDRLVTDSVNRMKKKPKETSKTRNIRNQGNISQVPTKLNNFRKPYWFATNC